MGLFSRRQIGNQYEALAKKHLCSQGLTFVEQNFTAKCGEIDLIMRDQQTIIFVEVKFRKNTHYGHAAEMVTPKKMHKLIKTAHLWLLQQNLSVHSTNFRFDVVAIENNSHNIDWIKNAITQG
ncbi:YraN family protein [Vibrio clamense]|uniref:YraN family protein n=1 Tax=Vibrio TaxID=662 RepID=UPI0021C29B9D|nr:YraN family protein [Vibrio cortegadensis]MDN3699498.1 YraN family protein [Vibrio cortegadensis]